MNRFQWLVSHWPTISQWLVVAGLPSIINALMKYPRAQTAFRDLLDVISMLTPKDSPGTLKMPFKRSEPPHGVLKAPPATPPVAVIFFLSLALLSNSSCCYFKKTCSVPVTDVIDCAIEATRSEVDKILPIVTAILTGSDTNWESELASLATSATVDAVSCAVQAVLGDLNISKSEEGPEMATPDQVDRGISRATAYLKNKKFK